MYYILFKMVWQFADDNCLSVGILKEKGATNTLNVYFGELNGVTLILNDKNNVEEAKQVMSDPLSLLNYAWTS